MRKIFLLLSLGLVALTGCKKDSTPSLVENPILPPSTETFAPGAAVTIKGSGFTDADEIWFRAQTKATDDIQATITKQTATEITFIVPQGLPAGEQTVLLKRDDQEMPLGKITVAEATTSTKLYAIGSTDDSDTEVLWEIDKTTGELTEIVKLPTESNVDSFESPVVDPTNGNIYLYQWIETTDALDLYRINPANKMLEKIGRLKEGIEDTHYDLCVIDNRLHALIEKEQYENEDNQETFYSLVAIDPNTAEQTLVADFGSLHQALNIPLSVSAGLDGVGKFFGYDMATKSLIVPIFKDVETDDDWQLTRFDIVNQKIIPGVGSSDNYISLFVKDSKACGAFYNDDINTVDFRLIDTENLTIGESLGSAFTGSNNKFFEETWAYDAATGKGYTTIADDSSDEYSAFGAFDFNTKEFKEIKQYANGIGLWTIFN